MALFLKLFYCCSITVVYIFSSPSQAHLPPLGSALPLGFVHVSFIVVPENPSPHLSSPLPSGYKNGTSNVKRLSFVCHHKGHREAV